ncbi:MAG: response regulator [Magnetococcales bacterium]|nr:response regulator [Magnetococcales bacterium]
MTNPNDKPRILIVDDIPGNLRVAQAALGGEYELFAAINGQKALEIAQSKRPHIILLDIMMPDMDGYEVCRRLKSDPVTSEATILFLSSKDEVMDEVKGIMLGAADFILKPIEPTLLKTRVMGHIQRALALQSLQKRVEQLEQRLKAGSQLAQQALAGDDQALPQLLAILQVPSP